MYKINKYPDGSGYVETDNEPEETFRINSYEDLWFLAQLVDAKSNLGVYTTITIPNLIDAQADVRFSDNQPHGLRLVMTLLGQLSADFRVFHPHNPEVVGLFPNVEILDNTHFIKSVLSELGVILKKDEPILMSADAGGFKPLMKLCKDLNWEGEVYSATKSREYKDGDTKLTQIIDRLDFGGKDILIVDDICVFGGTFKGIASLLKTRNIGKLYLAVSHITIETHKNNDLFSMFDKVFTTNSKYDNYYVPTLGSNSTGGYQPDNLKVFNYFKSTKIK